jgi:hypothetical protein
MTDKGSNFVFFFLSFSPSQNVVLEDHLICFYVFWLCLMFCSVQLEQGTVTSLQDSMIISKSTSYTIFCDGFFLKFMLFTL